jgi:hypothetical protein
MRAGRERSSTAARGIKRETLARAEVTQFDGSVRTATRRKCDLLTWTCYGVSEELSSNS